MAQRMISPENVCMATLARETGTSRSTLQNWRKKAKATKRTPVPGNGKRPATLSSEGKFLAVVTTFLETCRALGIACSRSRPQVSKDNPYSESLFRTYKYRPVFPSGGFEDLETSRLWTKDFVEWYNEKHHHSAIGFVSPGQRHREKHIEILEAREALYEKARRNNPRRWSGHTRIWRNPQLVFLNPGRPLKKEDEPQVLKASCTPWQ